MAVSLGSFISLTCIKYDIKRMFAHRFVSFYKNGQIRQKQGRTEGNLEGSGSLSTIDKS